MKLFSARTQKGFTLIELLIVIGLLGALAIGLLATIDPFEQLKKGRDTSTRNTVSEFYNANLRVYATKGEFIWGTASTWSTALAIQDMLATVSDLISAGELKTQFIDVAGSVRLSRIYVTNPQTDLLTVCFLPESKNFRLDPNTLYDNTGATLGDCTAQSGTNTACYWCMF